MVIQRLFSSFPDSWPGTALLLLRLCVSPSIVFHGMHSSIDTHAAPLLIAGAWTSAALILIGLWTPIAAGVAAVTEAAVALAGAAPEFLPHILVTVIAVSIVLLGPGAWSIDAYLYGRKRVI